MLGGATAGCECACECMHVLRAGLACQIMRHAPAFARKPASPSLLLLLTPDAATDRQAGMSVPMQATKGQQLTVRYLASLDDAEIRCWRTRKSGSWQQQDEDAGTTTREKCNAKSEVEHHRQHRVIKKSVGA